MRNSEKHKQWEKQYQEWKRPATIQYKQEWYLKNKEKQQKKAKIVYLSTKDKIRKQFIKQKYGLTLEQYDQMFAKQNGQCAICKTHQSNSKFRLHIDHDHVTGKIRGLLCINCNHGLGQFKDNLEFLHSAIEYLRLS